MKLDDFSAFLIKLASFGLEPLGQYYGTYGAEVIKINYPYINVKLDSLNVNGNDEIYNVPLKGIIGVDTVIKYPLSIGDRVLISFLHGKISYPVAEPGYPIEENEKIQINEKVDKTQTDFFQIVTKNGLEISETKDGFTIKKGKLEIECTEDGISLKTKNGSLSLGKSFAVSVSKNISLKAGSLMSKAINLSKLVSIINIMKKSFKYHTHLVPTPGGISNIPTDLITPPSQFMIQESSVSIDHIDFQ